MNLKPDTILPTPEEDRKITAAALLDPDARPLSDAELAQFRPVAIPFADLSEWDMDKIRALPAFDAADYLDSEEMIAAYLAELDDPAANEGMTPEQIAAMRADALDAVARARARLAS